MMRLKRFHNSGTSIAQSAARVAVLAVAGLAGGCTASVSGFDFPSFSLTDDQRSTQTASASTRSPQYLGNDRYASNSGYSAPRTYRESSVASQDLPDATPSSNAYSGGRTGNNYASNSRYDNASSTTQNNLARYDAPTSGNSGSGSQYGRSSGPGNSYTAGGRYGTVPPANTGAQPTTYAAANRYDAVPPASTASTNRYDPQPTPSLANPGDSVEVRSGDTLYGLSRRYNVSVAELMQLNNLSSTNLKLGQRLYLPQGVSGGQRYATTPTAPPTQTASIQPPPLSSDLSGKYSGSYTVRPGDSIYGISRNLGVPVAELQQANGITDPRAIKAGTVLRVPGSSGENYSPSVQQVAVRPAPQVSPTPSYGSSDASSPTQPTILNGANGNTQVAAVRNDPPPAPPASQPQSRPASGSDKLRWPVSGRIISGFGQRPDGTHNDGINLAVPMGTTVHAAEGGVVAYAGSELKGYGNLVLLRHDNGWVTAYAHNEDLKVKRGDKVERGQVIATAGRTGSVDQPQLHFELRQGSKPVDPVPFLDRL
jgi:murein DD-endopeptidase MepM/ murein hydrolase activator NlpD